MSRNRLSVCGLLLLAGCISDQPGADIRTVSSRSDLAMTADYRLVYRRTPGDLVLCAEPSPDIGRIVSAATSGSLTGSAKGLANVQPELALAFAASRAEGLAQLGQRLATIQLLRDSTYRACEAFANKAISSSTYAMIVSRYDDVMVTLLLGEMAAGAARPSSAALLAGSASTGGLPQATADAAVKLGLTRVDTAAKALATAHAMPGSTEAERTAKQAAVAAAQKDEADASALLRAALNAVGSAQVATMAAAKDAQPLPAAAATVSSELAAMQKSYLNDFNLDAVTVGCLSALSQFDWPQPQRPTARTNAVEPVELPPPAPQVATTGATSGAQDIGGAGNGLEQGVPFLSSHAGGAYSLQDECRAVLLNGRTLRAVAKGRLNQIDRELRIEEKKAGLERP